MCAFVVLGFVFFIPGQEIGLGNVSEMTYFVSSGTKNHNLVNYATGCGHLCWCIVAKHVNGSSLFLV